MSTKRLFPLAVVFLSGLFLAMDPLRLFEGPPGITPPVKFYEVEAAPPVPWRHPALLPADLDEERATYRRRQEAWVIEQFERELARFAAGEFDALSEARVEVLAGPLTPPSVLTGLGQAASEERTFAESQVVSSTLCLRVDGVDAASLMRFHADSLFELKHENPTATTAVELYGPRHAKPLPRAVSSGSRVPENQWLRTEVTAGSFLKKPTRLTHAIVLDTTAAVKVYRFSLFESDAPEGGADASFSHGVFFTRDVEGGAMLYTHSLFHGQEVPALGRSFIAKSIRSSYLEYGELYRQHAAGWIRSHPETKDGPR